MPSDGLTLHDTSGNEITDPRCDCGKRADTCMMGSDVHLWICNECLYGREAKVQPIVCIEGYESVILNPEWTIDLREMINVDLSAKEEKLVVDDDK